MGPMCMYVRRDTGRLMHLLIPLGTVSQREHFIADRYKVMVLQVPLTILADLVNCPCMHAICLLICHSDNKWLDQRTVPFLQRLGIPQAPIIHQLVNANSG